MSRLIDAYETYKALTEYYNIQAPVQQYVLKVALSSVPTVEAKLVKHGHWIKMSDADGYYYACSECGEELTRIQSFDPQFDLFPRLKSINKTKYCPSCGAKMDEAEE